MRDFNNSRTHDFNVASYWEKNPLKNDMLLQYLIITCILCLKSHHYLQHSNVFLRLFENRPIVYEQF